MTKEQKLLHEVGEALFGDFWQCALARELGIADRTMRRWVAGTSPIPEGIAPELGRICKVRAKDFAERIRVLNSWAYKLAGE